jgi:hypothetical protein
MVYGSDTAQIGRLNTKQSEYFEGHKFPQISLKLIDQNYLSGENGRFKEILLQLIDQITNV